MLEEERKQQPDFLELLAETYSQCAAQMLEFAHRLGFSRDVAEDIVQDAFLIALQKPETFMACENRVAWMFEILRNYMGHYFRDAQYMKRLQKEIEPLFKAKTEDHLPVMILYKGMISDEDLKLLDKAIIQRQPYSELSKEFGLTEPALRKRIQRARDRFRKAYGEDK